jgi:hypothetical protein
MNDVQIDVMAAVGEEEDVGGGRASGDELIEKAVGRRAPVQDVLFQSRVFRSRRNWVAMMFCGAMRGVVVRAGVMSRMRRHRISLCQIGL